MAVSLLRRWRRAPAHQSVGCTQWVNSGALVGRRCRRGEAEYDRLTSLLRFATLLPQEPLVPPYEERYDRIVASRYLTPLHGLF